MKEIIVAGVSVLPPLAADADGLYWFINPFSLQRVGVKDTKVAAACECVLGLLFMPKDRITAEVRRDMDALRAYVAEHDPATYAALLD